jgi:NCS1 family nucleobase:cation symporter-1
MSSSSGFVNWLVAYSALLGPVVGVVLADYYLVRGRVLDMDDLYSMSPSGRYWYQVRRAWGCTAQLLRNHALHAA